MSDTIFIPKELEARNEALYNELVPPSGYAETIEGELLRAANRVVYRYYNDGDRWFEGYGCETAGPAAAFLMGEFAPAAVDNAVRNSDGIEDDNAYERSLIKITEAIVSYIEGKKGVYEENTNGVDMLDTNPLHEDDSSDDDYYWGLDEDEDDLY